jgi:fatty-acyl-CoA synthase
MLIDCANVVSESKDCDATLTETNVEGSLDAPLLLVYTSGTTGQPKGAVLTQNALLFNALNSVHMHELTPSDHILTVLPMFHVGGMNIHTTPGLYVGATISIHPRFDPAATLAAIEKDRPSLLVLVPATIAALIQQPSWQTTDLTSLRIVTTGSSIVPHSLIEAWHDRGIPVIQVYGSTETGPVALYQREEDAMMSVGSTGRGALHTEVRIVDDAGDDVKAGASGELLLRGPNLLQKYWKDQGASVEAFENDWFCTGDIGYRDERGYVFINDRKTDVVISGGENIYPAELEQVLDRIDGIAESSVVGTADDQWGEIPVAVVVINQNATITVEDILSAFDGRLARYKHPKAVSFVPALPRNVMGKVLKHELRRAVDNGTIPFSERC